MTHGFTAQPDAERPRRSVFAALVVSLWQLHAIAAVGIWRALPQGFPLWHLRCWSNTVVPAALLAAALVATVAFVRGRARPIVASGLALLGFWATALAALCVLFPTSVGNLRSGHWAFAGQLPEHLPLGIPLATYAALVTTLWLARRYRDPSRVRPCSGSLFARLAALSVGALAGAVLVCAQRGPAPTTRPAGGVPPSVATHAPPPPSPLELPGGVTIEWRTPRVLLRCGGLVLDVQPVLTFISRSPDRFWTILATPEESALPARVLTGWSLGPGAVASLSYRDDGESSLRIARAADVLELDASTHLPRAVFTHLNAFTQIQVSNASRLSLAFSPCPGVPVEVLPWDYPTGRPARAAYRDAADVFRVVQARDAEKGPYTTLASGRLASDESLGVTLLDAGRPACRVTFADWSRQASVALSPAAGWGVTEGSITFGYGREAVASILLTLADTGLGRGWDSVGHAPGTYRNRVRIESIP